jgi:hypothetical protein
MPDSTLYVDFSTGKKVNFTPSDPSQAFAAYGAQLEKYPFSTMDSISLTLSRPIFSFPSATLSRNTTLVQW